MTLPDLLGNGAICKGVWFATGPELSLGTLDSVTGGNGSACVGL